jgi:Fic-DOC domain mobile mystery protein B
MFDGDPAGSTRLGPDELAELLPAHIQSRAELNVWEQENILEAARWTTRTNRPTLSEPTIRELHRRMFSETWEWAGRYRRHATNLGSDWGDIPVAVRNLVDDGRLWLDEAVFSIDEIAVRLHHRLVQIHPFPNGNGRLARLWADMFLRRRSRPPLEWRSSALVRSGKAREAYISSLQSADRGDFDAIIALLLSRRPD